MSVQRSGTNHPMSFALANDDEFIRAQIADREDAMVRSGAYGDRDEARGTLAGRIGVAPGTIENLRRRRSKGLRGLVREKILAFIVQDLQRAIAREQFNLETALRLASRPDETAIFDAQGALAAARKTLAELVTVKNSPGA